MEKNIVKNIMKAVVTTAMVATMFVGFGSEAEAKEVGYEDFMEYKGITNPMDICTKGLMEEMNRWCWAINHPGEDFDEARLRAIEEFAVLWDEINGNTVNVNIPSPSVSHTDMLALVNADRTACGVGTLVWNADLEAVAQQRAIEVMNNAYTEDFRKAVDTNDVAAYSEIVHRGHREGLGENAIVSFYTGVTSATANTNWIASANHHEARTRAGYTQYACASYTDPLTGMETWVEVFSNGTPATNASTFDYIRYATDYPDLASAFGQNSTALYNHYITCGKVEGRKAYYTDGTAIKQ